MEVLNDKRAQDLYKLIKSLKSNKKIRIGCNETIKAINRNTAIIAVMAADASPECLIEPLPILCEQKGIQYVVVSDKQALGKACGLEINVIACAIVAGKHEDSCKLQDNIAKVLK